MNYVENIYVCLAAPLLIAILCMRGRGKKMMMFIVGGMTACLLSSYISTFLADLQNLDLSTASLTVAPMVEESMKFLPILFFLLVFEPKKDEVSDGVLMTALGFATFENACYLTGNGATHILHLIIRGFGTGSMHIVCGFIVAVGLMYLWNRVWLQAAGTIGLLSIAATYHGVYNLLVSQTGIAAMVGYVIPALTIALNLVITRLLVRRPSRNPQDQ